MPIVDGLTSAKMIRSFEKSHPTHILSTRASLNGRVPIIAVSASLVEKDRQIYIDAGFDGWILKPISFNRLSELLTGIVDREVRRENLYKPGGWENGGWFDEVQKDVFAANTKPSAEPPTSAPGPSGASEGVKIAAMVDDPAVKEEGDSRQSQEQQRMLAEQRRGRGEEQTEEVAPKSFSMPELGSKDYHRGSAVSESSEATITDKTTESPAPIAAEDPMEQT